VGKQPAKRGPKTVPGRLRASMNSTKHGILSPRPVVHHYESETGWKGHRDSILKSLDPQNERYGAGPRRAGGALLLAP
jgi:hypothetical protein